MDDIIIDELIRSHRRTISLIIDSAGRLVVRAPMKVTITEINKFINRKRSWIIEKKNLVLEKNKNKKPFEIKDGEAILFLGEKKFIKVADNAKYALELSGNQFILNNKYMKNARKLLILLLRKQAAKIIGEKALKFSEVLNLPFNKFGITNAQRRWGSCSSKKSLNFSWRLVMAPEQVIDYVVIHELVHTIYMNHSKEFWAIIKKIMPNYEIYKIWLQNNSHLLNL